MTDQHEVTDWHLYRPITLSEVSAEPITLGDIAAIGGAILFVLAGPLIIAGVTVVYIFLNS